jgi:glucose/arabinose dehydrogenase
VRAVKQGPDGDLYLAIDSPQGRILRLQPQA